MSASGVFITGTDTGVGKTTIACRVIKMLEANGLETAVRKPVESGCIQGEHGLIARDAECLAAASKTQPPSQQVCSYRYKEVTSPARAVMLAGGTLYIDQLVACCCNEKRFTVVEGAGGLFSPIATDGLNIDLIVALALPVVVVSCDRLGSIGQVLSVLEALATRRLKAVAVVLNRMHPQSYGSELDNYSELSALTPVPIIQVYKDYIDDVAIAKLCKLITETNSLT